MPTLSDTQGGVVTVSGGGNVASERSWVTIVPGNPVEIHGEPKVQPFLRLTLRFNGGTADPTVLSAEPVNVWSQDAFFIVYYQGNELGEFVVRWAHSSYIPPAPILSDVIGTSFNQVASTGFATSPTYDLWGFVMKLNGTNVLPANGDQCVITLNQL